MGVTPCEFSAHSDNDWICAAVRIATLAEDDERVKAVCECYTVRDKHF
jgi:hypothetical protein